MILKVSGEGNETPVELLMKIDSFKGEMQFGGRVTDESSILIEKWNKTGEITFLREFYVFGVGKSAESIFGSKWVKLNFWTKMDRICSFGSKWTKLYFWVKMNGTKFVGQIGRGIHLWVQIVGFKLVGQNVLLGQRYGARRVGQISGSQHVGQNVLIQTGGSNWAEYSLWAKMYWTKLVGQNS